MCIFVIDLFDKLKNYRFSGFSYFAKKVSGHGVCCVPFSESACNTENNDSTPEGRAVSVTRELDLSLLCRIWLFGRHLVSLAEIAEVWPPFFLATETPDIALDYTSREIWSE